jgi:hypothetical protein
MAFAWMDLWGMRHNAQVQQPHEARAKRQYCVEPPNAGLGYVGGPASRPFMTIDVSHSAAQSQTRTIHACHENCDGYGTALDNRPVWVLDAEP